MALYLKTREGSQGLYIVSFSGAKLTNKSINLIAFCLHNLTFEVQCEDILVQGWFKAASKVY